MKSKKEKSAKPSIARTVMGLIHDGRLDTKEGKDEALKVVNAVKKQFPKSKFGLTHYFWYLSRFRRQKDLGLKTDHLVLVEGGKKGKAKTNKKAKAPKKAKKASKKAAPKPAADVVES